jgi:Ser/Thr protein kinase RdoA (MazF antagonist)
VARRVSAGEPSFRWLDRLQAVAVSRGVRLAPLIPSHNGALTVGGWTVEPLLEGYPGTDADLPEIRRALRRMHRATRRWPARPGLVPRLPMQLAQPVGEVAAVHGDVHSANVLRLAGGDLAIVDWEEARIGDTRLDLGFPGNAAGRAAHATAEVRACWKIEPERARAMARLLQTMRRSPPNWH